MILGIPWPQFDYHYSTMYGEQDTDSEVTRLTIIQLCMESRSQIVKLLDWPLFNYVWRAGHR